jgi:hypothetical protein
MAGRILKRRELRQAEPADQGEAIAPAGLTDAQVPKRGRKPKSPAVAKAKKPRAKKVPPRMVARWGVFDTGMRQLAIFDYNQRAAAEEKVADLIAKKKGIFFLKIVKEPMPEPPPAEGPGAE